MCWSEWHRSWHAISQGLGGKLLIGKGIDIADQLWNGGDVHCADLVSISLSLPLKNVLSASTPLLREKCRQAVGH